MPRRHVIDPIEIALIAQQLRTPPQSSSLLQGLLQHLAATPANTAEQAAALLLMPCRPMLQLAEAIEKMGACPESRQVTGDRVLTVRAHACCRRRRRTF